MTHEERAMLAFATKWFRFDGGDEYILPEFGLTPPEFYQRVLSMVTSTLICELDFATRNQLREFCSFKISRIAPKKPSPEHVG